MNNNEFTYIKEVAKQKSFSKASKALGISQPALSNYIKKLEDRMGVLLFDRSISPIEITEFGKAYLEYAGLNQTLPVSFWWYVPDVLPC